MLDASFQYLETSSTSFNDVPSKEEGYQMLLQIFRTGKVWLKMWRVGNFMIWKKALESRNGIDAAFHWYQFAGDEACGSMCHEMLYTYNIIL